MGCQTRVPADGTPCVRALGRAAKLHAQRRSTRGRENQSVRFPSPREETKPNRHRGPVSPLDCPGYVSFSISSVVTIPSLSSGCDACQQYWDAPLRSEEHTSELQSHSDLVCRLLLEKKKKRMM